jgi:hypothetical protein
VRREVLTRVPAGRVWGSAIKPTGKDRLCLKRFEVVDDVVKAQDASGTHHRRHPDESQAFPEVWQVMEGIARVYGVNGRTGMLVAEKPRLHAVEVLQPGCGRSVTHDAQHRWRDINRNDVTESARSCEGENARSSAEVDDG